MVPRSTSLLLLAAVIGLALSAVVPSAPRNMARRPVPGFLQKSVEPAEFDSVPTMYMSNQQDNFNPNDDMEYLQRYWSNNAWYKPGGPVFFMIGGEAAADQSWVTDPTLPWAKMAQEQGAWLFLLEHRYYGQSHPAYNMDTDSLQWLTIAQALEDCAGFIQEMNDMHYLGKAKWVAFGLSYGGALAAWMRVRHPELVFAAVSSSGMLQAEVDVVEYLEVVKTVLINYSPSCGASVTAGFNQVAQLLQTASGRQSLKNAFKLCDDIDITNDKEIKLFWENVYSPYMNVVQNSGNNVGPYRTRLTIQNAICRYHQQNSSTLAKMQAVNNYFNMEFGCNDIGYKDFVDFMKDVTFGPAADPRAWLWQKCTEFGFIQSTDSTTAGPWFGGAANLPASFYLNECSDIFGGQYNADSVAKAVAQTNAYFGGRDTLNATRVILSNGLNDRWHALGKLTSSDPTIVPVVINGTGHCADMYTNDPYELPSLTAARETIKNTLYGWLKQ